MISVSLGCFSASAQELDQKNTSHIKVYPELDQLVDRADSLVREGRFAEALAIYEAALTRSPNTMVPRGPARARGVWQYVLERMAEWPEEGRALRRRRVDGLARQAFESAKRLGDRDALEEVIGRYPLSSYVDDAFALIGNLQLDAGEFDKAARTLERLLELDGDVPKPVTLARLGMACSRAGRKARAEELAERAVREYPDASVRVGNGEVNLAAHLGALAATTRPERAQAPPLSVPGWEMIGGAPSGSRLAESGVVLGPLAWSVQITGARLSTDPFRLRRLPTLAVTPDFRPLHPAVADGILYVHNENTVTALSLGSRFPEPLWQHRVPPPPGEIMFDNRLIFATTVHDGRVFANLVTEIDAAEDRLGYVRVKFPFPRRALFALDAYSGEVLWKLGGRLHREALKENATFSAPPAPDGDRLYVGAIKQMSSTDLFEHHVLCLNAATGKILWSTFVASGGTEINLFGNSTRESIGSPVAVTEDSVYYVTNHGAAAALEKKTGRIRWTYRYQQLRVSPTRSVYVMKNPLEWVNSPPVVAEDVVMVAPTDSRHLYALDARTGKRRWEILRSGDIRTIYGVKDRTLVLGGERLEFYDVRTGKMSAPPVTDELAGTGRGVLAEDGIYVPCRDKLRRVRWDGSWDEAAAKPWPDATAGEGGNLFVVDGAVILATQDSVRVYYDRLDQELAIRRELARHPNDPSVVYRAALRFHQSGAGGLAARHFSRVVELTRNSRRREDLRLGRAARRRLYAASMELGRSELGLGRFDRAADQFAAAQEAAPDVRAAVQALLMLGRARLLSRKIPGAIGVFQRLLQEHGGVVVDGRTVFETARGSIAQILRLAGRSEYGPWEEVARRQLEEARRRGSVEAYAEVYRRYPNSLAAETALLESAGVHRKLDRTDGEVAVLRTYLRDYPDAERAPQVQVALVSALERKGYTASARVFLRRMARLPGSVRVTVDGEEQAARTYAARRLKSGTYASAAGAPPAIGLSPPIRRVFKYTERDFREGAPLRVEGVPPEEAAGLLIMDYGMAIRALSIDGGGARWKFDTPGRVRYAAYLEGTLLVAEGRRVTRVDPKDGRVLWSYASPELMQHFVLSGPLLCFVTLRDRSESMVAALDADRGAVAWSQTFEGIAATRLFRAGDAIVFLSNDPNRIQAFEADTGRRLMGNVTYTPGRRITVRHVSENLLLLHYEDRFLEAYGLPDGRLRWRVELARYITRGIGVGEKELVFVATRRVGGLGSRVLMAAVNLANGKIVRMKGGLAVGDPRFLLLEGGTAYVVARDPDRSLRVSAVGLSDLTVAWSTVTGGRTMTLLPPVLAKDHLILGGFSSDPLGRFAIRGVLLDKRGRVVQNIDGEHRFERPPGFTVDNDRVTFSVDTKVEVHR